MNVFFIITAILALLVQCAIFGALYRIGLVLTSLNNNLVEKFERPKKGQS